MTFFEYIHVMIFKNINPAFQLLYLPNLDTEIKIILGAFVLVVLLLIIMFVLGILKIDISKFRNKSKNTHSNNGDTEKVVKESEDRFRILSELSSEGILIHQKGRVIDINKRLENIFGYTKEYLISRDFIDIIIPVKYQKLVYSNIKKDHSIPYIIEGRKVDGELLPLEVESRGYYDRGDKYNVISFRDMTYRYNVDKALKAILILNKKVKNHTENEIIEWGLEEAERLTKSKIGYFHFVNDDEKSIALTAWTKNTMKRCTIEKIVAQYPIDQAGIWAECVYTRKPALHNDYLTAPNKKGYPEGHFPVLRHMSVPIFDRGKIRAIIGVGNKTSEYTAVDSDLLSFFAENIWSVIKIKRLDDELNVYAQELKELNATKDKFFSIVAHDMKNPFNAIIGFTNLLIDCSDKKDYDNIKVYAEFIKDATNQSISLLSNLLDWSRSQSGVLSFDPKLISVVEVIDEIKDEVSGNAKQKSIEIVTAIQQNLQVYADNNMLKTILRNLISNSIKYSKPANKVIISATQSNGNVDFSVIDMGVGIEKKNIDKLFKIESHFSTVGTFNEKGNGLGLIICKDFIDRHKGKIWIESEVNKGTAFHFSIPVKK